jgi:excisionase family DNA binding protein
LSQNHYTTSQAAKLLSVSADTVLKWVKASKITSYRTPGGHYRIPSEAVEALLPGKGPDSSIDGVAKGFDFCWNFYADSDAVRDECRDCMAFRSKARRCYEMRDIPEEFGHLRLFCQSSCEDCKFYQLTHLQRRSVLVVSRHQRWLTDLVDQSADSVLKLETAHSEYECGALIEKFRPDFIVLDRSFGAARTRDICRHLIADDRIPFTRIILTSRLASWDDNCQQEVCGWIEKPFTIEQLGEFIEGNSLLKIQDDRMA